GGIGGQRAGGAGGERAGGGGAGRWLGSDAWCGQQRREQPRANVTGARTHGTSARIVLYGCEAVPAYGGKRIDRGDRRWAQRRAAALKISARKRAFTAGANRS